MRIGFGSIVIILVILALGAFAAAVYYFGLQKGQWTSINLQSSPQTSNLQSSQADLGLIREEDRGKEMDMRYYGRKMFQHVTLPRAGGTWQIQEYTLQQEGIILDPVYKNQVINGLKNFSIILHNAPLPNYERWSQGGRPVIGFTKKSIIIFESLVKNANLKIMSGTSLNNLPIEEQSAYILSNPSLNDNVLTEQKYVKAFEVVKKYLIEQNKGLASELKSLCDNWWETNIVERNFCYKSAIDYYVDDFACDLIDEKFIEFNAKSYCYRSRAIYNQDMNLCKFADHLDRVQCEAGIYKVQ